MAPWTELTQQKYGFNMGHGKARCETGLYVVEMAILASTVWRREGKRTLFFLKCDKPSRPHTALSHLGFTFLTLVLYKLAQSGRTIYSQRLDRKHCKMLVGFLTRHINLHYMLHKIRRAKAPSCRRCGAEKDTLVHILCECLALEKIRIKTFGFARMDSDQIKGTRLSSIMTLNKGAGLLNSPINLNERDKAIGPKGLSPGVLIRIQLAKKKYHIFQRAASIFEYSQMEL